MLIAGRRYSIVIDFRRYSICTDMVVHIIYTTIIKIEKGRICNFQWQAGIIKRLLTFGMLRNLAVIECKQEERSYHVDYFDHRILPCIAGLYSDFTFSPTF